MIGLQAIIGGVNFGVTLLLSIWLLDRVGRRPLLMWSYVAMTVMYVILALSSHTNRVLGLLTVIGIVVAYAVGPGPVTWIMPTEMFPLSVRTQMLSICVCGMWQADSIVVAQLAGERAECFCWAEAYVGPCVWRGFRCGRAALCALCLRARACANRSCKHGASHRVMVVVCRAST